MKEGDCCPPQFGCKDTINQQLCKFLCDFYPLQNKNSDWTHCYCFIYAYFSHLYFSLL